MLCFLLLFLPFLVNAQQVSNLCQNQCDCRRVTSPSRDIVLTEAICNNLNLTTFPSNAQLPNDTIQISLVLNLIVELSNSATDQYTSQTLEILDLSFNDIKKIDGFFANVPNLRQLDLSHNLLQMFDKRDVFMQLAKLETLDLSYNQIVSLNSGLFLPLKSLKSLNFGYNSLVLGENVSPLLGDLGINANLLQLDVSNLNLTSIPDAFFNRLSNLTHLTLADNPISQYPPFPRTLRYLDVSGVDFIEIHSKYLTLPDLTTLKLNRLSKLVEVPEYAFFNLKSLHTLEMTDCQRLKHFNELVFGLLIRNTSLPLKHLNLARNSLRHLNETFEFVFRDFVFVDVGDNPWVCDCDILWMQHLSNFHRPERIRCIIPLTLNDRKVSQLTDKDLMNCFPEKYGTRGHRILISCLILLIIVLAALVSYLVYYAPRLRSVGGLSPDSPYSMANTREI